MQHSFEHEHRLLGFQPGGAETMGGNTEDGADQSAEQTKEALQQEMETLEAAEHPAETTEKEVEAAESEITQRTEDLAERIKKGIKNAKDGATEAANKKDEIGEKFYKNMEGVCRGLLPDQQRATQAEQQPDVIASDATVKPTQKSALRAGVGLPTGTEVAASQGEQGEGLAEQAQETDLVKASKAVCEKMGIPEGNVGDVEALLKDPATMQFIEDVAAKAENPEEPFTDADVEKLLAAAPPSVQENIATLKKVALAEKEGGGAEKEKTVAQQLASFLKELRAFLVEIGWIKQDVKESVADAKGDGKGLKESTDAYADYTEEASKPGAEDPQSTLVSLVSLDKTVTKQLADAKKGHKEAKNRVGDIDAEIQTAQTQLKEGDFDSEEGKKKKGELEVKITELLEQKKVAEAVVEQRGELVKSFTELQDKIKTDLATVDATTQDPGTPNSSDSEKPTTMESNTIPQEVIDTLPLNYKVTLENLNNPVQPYKYLLQQDGSITITGLPTQQGMARANIMLDLQALGVNVIDKDDKGNIRFTPTEKWWETSASEANT